MIDQFRVVQEAVYTADFTVPSAPFPIGGAEASYDPYWDQVIALLDDSSAGTLVDAKGLNVVENVGGVEIINSGTRIGLAAARFTAAGQFLRMPDNTNAFDFGSDAWTMEAWVKPSAVNTGIGYLIGRGTSASFGGFSLVLNNMRPQLRWTTTGTSWNKVTPLVTDSALTLGIWYHVAAVRFGNSFFLFVNGKMISSITGAVDTLTASAIPVTIGNGNDGTGQFYGTMDSIRITRGASRYISEFTPKMKTRYASNGNITASSNDPYWPKVPALLEYTKDIGVGPDAFSIVLKRNGVLIDSSSLLFGKPTVRLESGANGGFNYSNGSKTLLGAVDFTAEAWIKTNFNDVATFLPIVGQWHASATGAWALGVTNSKLRWIVRNALDLSGVTNIADGLWHHVAVSHVGGTLRLFVDGVLDASAPVGAYPVYNGNVQVGYNIAAEAASGFITHLSRVRLTQGKGRYVNNFTVGKDTVQLTSLAA
ncbi:Concanavalin A-like lectin/glucanases superfamily protein [compost metagenome]